jgi:glycerophosphoryl diester phosphodiesterase
MGDASDTGGHSMLVHPNGEVISDAGQRTGLIEVSADLKDKWQRPKSFGTGTAAARSIVEETRRPRVYRPNRQYTVSMSSHPRVVAHRGFSKACPENTLPAFAAAISLGAHEIELDIRPSLDRELVIHHDAAIKLADGRLEPISAMKWDEIQNHDMGASFSEAWRGVRITRFNDVLQAFAGQAMFNVHVKDPGEQGFVIREIKRLAEQFDIADQIYIAGNRPVMEAALQYAPEIMRCCLVEQSSWNLVDHAIHYKCARLQFFNKYCSEEMIAKAHAAGISCNLFYTDKAEEAAYYYGIGIDNILTNAVSEIIPVAASLSK